MEVQGKPKSHSLLNKRYCEVCEKDISTSYFSKHVKSKGHMDKAALVETNLSESDSDVEDLKFEKVDLDESSSDEEVPLQESDDESVKNDEKSESEKSESEKSESEKSESEAHSVSESDDDEVIKEEDPVVVSGLDKVDDDLFSESDESPPPVKWHSHAATEGSSHQRRKRNIKPSVVKKPVKTKLNNYRGIYEVSSSSEEENAVPQVYGSGFIKFIRELDQEYNVDDPDTIKEIYNDVMGFKPSKRLYIKRQSKQKLKRYLDKFETDNADIDHEFVSDFMLDVLENL